MPINTKDILANAFFELCRTRPVRKIRTQDIADYCNVSRQTVYNHFRDKQEIAEYYWMRQVGNPLSEFSDYSNWSVKSAQEIEKNWWFYKKVIKDSDFWAWHEKWLYDNMREYIISRFGMDKMTYELDDTLRLWIVGSCRTFLERKDTASTVGASYIAMMRHRNMPDILLQYFPISLAQ